MAASSSASLRRSHGSSGASSKQLSRSHNAGHDDDDTAGPSIPIDTLVNYLLAAKRSLSSMNLVLRANEIANAARQSYEDAVILAAQAGFLRRAITDQINILVRVRHSLQATYDWGKKDFKSLVKSMDMVDASLEGTVKMLRSTGVESVFRAKGEERRNLLDFIDESNVHGLRDAMKKSIQELQGIQQSFDGDLLRFDTDIRNLKKILLDSPTPPSLDTIEPPNPPMPELLESLFDHSANMAQLLVSLTKHFDMCVTAIRTTDGAVALARRRAAEASQSQGSDGVSISGVIAEQESNVSDLQPKTAQDREEVMKVVQMDAEEVDDAVREIQERLAAMEQEYVLLQTHADTTRHSYGGMLDAYNALSDIGDRLGDYIAAEEDFKARWELEKDAVYVRLDEMRGMRDFYEGYASAYDGLLLEVERRHVVNERIRSVWRKAQDAVDKLFEADRAARDAFRQDVGEYLPTDLWAGMQPTARRWAVLPLDDDGNVDEAAKEDSSPALRRSVVEGARLRLEKQK